MSSPFIAGKTKKYGTRKFNVQIIDIAALADDVSSRVTDLVEMPDDLAFAREFPLLRVCNPNVSTEKLLELAREGLSGNALELLISHLKFPVDNAIEVVKSMEDKSWNYESAPAQVESVSMDDLKSALENFEDDYGNLIGWSHFECIWAYMSGQPEFLTYIREVAPSLLEVFEKYEKENLFKYFVMSSPLSGKLSFEMIRSEHNGAALLTEFVRMKRDGDLDDEEAFDISDWDDDVEEEFDEFISELRDEIGFGEGGNTEAELGTALHLPAVYKDEDIPLSSTFDIHFSSFFIATTADENTFSDIVEIMPEGATLVGLQGFPGANTQPPVLPLFNSFGELEELLVCATCMNESLEDLINEYVDTQPNGNYIKPIPFYVGDIRCDGQIITGDAGWLDEGNDFPEQESLLFTNLPSDEYGIVAFIDGVGLEDLLAVALVRGQMKRKYQLVSALYPEIQQSSLKKHISKVIFSLRS